MDRAPTPTKPQKLATTTYTASKRIPFKITSPLSILAIVIILGIATGFILSINKSKPANASRRIQSTATSTVPKNEVPGKQPETSAIEFPLCEPSESTFGTTGTTNAIQCVSNKNGTTRFEYFNTIEELEIFILQYSLATHPDNPQISFRIGEYNNMTRLLIADHANLRVLDIRSSYREKELLDWLIALVRSSAL